MKLRTAVAGVASAFAAIPILIASSAPASADPVTPQASAYEYCLLVVQNGGYSVGPNVKAACKFSPGLVCYNDLRDLGVRTSTAATACQVQALSVKDETTTSGA
ncbi:hypothetical protein AB0392_48960 [Nonomuraea angiospora]|uniref:hypothetical protein n=1 Tax=Nonomuraea angiospora TaxID=46172 RepID=UPI00344FF692